MYNPGIAHGDHIDLFLLRDQGNVVSSFVENLLELTVFEEKSLFKRLDLYFFSKQHFTSPFSII